MRQVKHYQTNTMLFLNYIKQNTYIVLCFSTLVKQNANDTECPLNHVPGKTINAFCFNQSNHNAKNAMCYLNQIKQCKTKAMLCLNYVKQNTTKVLCF